MFSQVINHPIVASTSIAHTICTEIWQEIFLWHLALTGPKYDGTDAEDLDGFYPLKGPLPVSQICSRLRNMVISFPQMWVTIKLVLGESRNSRVELVKLWLARSDQLPLNIIILDQATSVWSFLAPGLATVLLMEESRRWKTFRLAYTISITRSRLQYLAPIRGNLQLLESLSLHQTEFSYTPFQAYQSRPPVDLFEDAPALLRLRMNTVNHFGKQLTFPLHQLRHIDFRDHFLDAMVASTNTCLRIISDCPNLYSVCLNCAYFDDLLDPFLDMVTHPNLHCLRISARYVCLPNSVIDEEELENRKKGLGEFFDRLTLPNIEELRITSDRERKWDHQSLCRFLERGNQLKKLDIPYTERLKHMDDYARLAPMLFGEDLE